MLFIKMIRSLFVFSIVLAVVAAKKTAVEECIHLEGSLPTKTEIEGCTTLPCQVSDEDLVINMKFRTPHQIESMQTRATLYVDRGVTTVPLAMNLAQYSETCDHLIKNTCPVKSGKNLNLSFPVPINTSFLPAGMTYALELQIVDEEETALTCLRATVTRSD